MKPIRISLVWLAVWLNLTGTVTSLSMETSLIGAQSLRKLVLDAARHDVSQSMDLNGIVWLEHINLVVGSKLEAEHFYVDFLGFSIDASSSFHRNLGQQQVHLAANGDTAQRLTGSMGLVVPSLEAVRERVAAAQDALKSTDFAVVEDDVTNGCMTIRCPWGNIMHLYDLTVDEQQISISDSPKKMVKHHAEGGQYSASRMAVRGNPGIRYVEVTCPTKTTKSIAHFYKEIFGCVVYTPDADKAIVCVGPGVHLCFVEDAALSDEAVKAMEGVHICIYANDFHGLYDRLKLRNLIWTNPRFTHLDSCDTWEDAAMSRTLRFKDILDLSTGKKVLELEHETRPLIHGQYMKVPKYERR